MRRYPLLVLAALAALLTFGCAGEDAGEASTPAPETQAKPETTVEAAIVEVAPTGTEFEPAIEPDRLPPGVWFCDMGTTHYARVEQSEDPCPVCGMTLVQKAAEAEETEGGGGA
jgi:hypothetical protein